MDQDTSVRPVPTPDTSASPSGSTSPLPPLAETPAPGFGLREVMLIALALAGGGLITYALLMGRGVSRTQAAPASAATSATDSARRDAKPAVAVQPWSAARRELWLGNRRKGIAYDVNANEPVGAWMRTVRPILVVRCTAGTMEAFVVTDTAAQIEPKTEDHTVTLQFDGETPSTERWPDSAEHDALFAPDAAAFAARVAAANELRFGFIPHNSSPVTARFHVAGLASLLEPAGKHCTAKSGKR